MRKIFLGAIAALGSCFLSAQSQLPLFGFIPHEDFDITECKFDPEAEAVVIFDFARTELEPSTYEMITKRRVRVKVLHERGSSRGDIVIPFYSHNGFEFHTNIKAAAYNRNQAGEVTQSVLEKKSIFTEKMNQYWSKTSFAIPNVKAGTVFEYEYESRMKHYGGLEYWNFQGDLPVLLSGYYLQVPPNTEFAYSVQKRFDYPILVKPLPDVGGIYFEMKNIPALRVEPYMDAPKDYQQRVIFQLATYRSSYGYDVSVATDWKKLAQELMGDKRFGAHLNKSLDSPELDGVLASVSDPLQRLNTIYNYVRRNLGWNQIGSLMTTKSLRSVWSEKQGTSSEVNLILINLLKKYGLETYPLLVAERDFGKIDTTYPYLERFNKVAAIVFLGNKNYILDATDQFVLPGLTPYPLLNTIGFLVDRKNPAKVRINATSYYKKQVEINSVLDKTGMVRSVATFKLSDYARSTAAETFSSGSMQDLVSSLFVSKENFKIDSVEFLPGSDDNEPSILRVESSHQMSSSGDLYFHEINFLSGMEKNPFVSANRFTNVNFGYPREFAINHVINLPDEARVEEFPANKVLVNPDNTISASRMVTLEGKKLNILITYKQLATLVEANQYAKLRQYFVDVTKMLGESIVIKMNPN